MELVARSYHCARCHQQVIICPMCDHGNHYCAADCSTVARMESLRRAGCRYQSTSRGKHKHAVRQQRYRQRQLQKVTHQGSPLSIFRDLLLKKTRVQPKQVPPPFEGQIGCHFCGRLCAPSTRTDFFRGRAYRFSCPRRM